MHVLDGNRDAISSNKTLYFYISLMTLSQTIKVTYFFAPSSLLPTWPKPLHPRRAKHRRNPRVIISTWTVIITSR